jgi:SpoIID/LytB domain protein
MAWEMPDLLFFYNGPQCGASAPDHAHLQAGSRGLLPIERDWLNYENHTRKIYSLPPTQQNDTIDSSECGIYLLTGYACPAFLIRTHSVVDKSVFFERLYNALPIVDDENEPRLNILCWRQAKGNGGSDELITIVFPRKKHRPECYSANGSKQYLISPGAIDMGGLLIAPRREDYDRMTTKKAAAILSEVTLDETDLRPVIHALADQVKETKAERSERPRFINAKMKEPKVNVGIVSAQCIHFSCNTPFRAKGYNVEGEQTVQYSEGCILWNGNLYSELTLIPADDNASFSLHDVTIGVNFHWERKETQTFKGVLRFVVEEEKICAINILPVEDYLISVISSEMKSTSSMEFLKAHAVISRSWLLAQMERRREPDSNRGFFNFPKGENEYIRWYDREDHTIFDVCADDHCQRYQGITRANNPAVVEAIRQTRGLILMDGKNICDARFSKCCGGVTEEYEYCWEDRHLPALSSIRDLADEHDNQNFPDLSIEKEAERWIRSNPPALCNTKDKEILSQVLNDYDLETTDFYRWKVSYTQSEIAQLITEKLKMDFGAIVDLIPLERGHSGRISKLKIVGTEKMLTIGKELEIRRTLSTTHLLSSAFVVDKETSVNGVPSGFTLVGAGWGHGVGLCQIGAAVMGNQGYSYDDILRHYYSGVTIKSIYK